MFLQLVAGGHLLLFVTRSEGWFFRPPFPALPLVAAILATQALAVADVRLRLAGAADPLEDYRLGLGLQPRLAARARRRPASRAERLLDDLTARRTRSAAHRQRAAACPRPR